MMLLVRTVHEAGPIVQRYTFGPPSCTVCTNTIPI